MTRVREEPPEPDDEATRIARKVAGRAIRRLGLLELAMLVTAVFLCLAAGGILALLVSTTFPVSFRLAWAVASLAVFVIPALFAWRNEQSS